MKRKNFSSGAKWEDIVGYSRAVQIGDLIEVAGTTAVRDGEIVGKGNAFEQTRYIFNLVESVLKKAGASMDDVIRTRIYLTNIKDWEDVAKAHHLFFGNVKPACTVVEVSALVDPEMLVEIEVTAVSNRAAGSGLN